VVVSLSGYEFIVVYIPYGVHVRMSVLILPEAEILSRRNVSSYNSTVDPRRKDEHGVKVVRVLAVVSTTMSKRVWDTGVL